MSNVVPGVLAWYFIAAVVLTLPASWVVLVAYRRAVRRGMQGSAGPEVGAEGSGGGERRARVQRRAAPATAARMRRRLVSAYGLGALVAAVVLTAFTFAGNRDVEPTAFRVFIFVYVFAWPLAPALAALLNDGAAMARFVAGYVLLGAAIVLGWSLVGRLALGHPDVQPLANLGGFLVVLATTAALPFVVVLVSGARRIGPVVPMALAGLLVFSFGALALQSMFIRAIDVGSVGPLLVRIGYTPLFLIAALPIGLVCWRAQRWLGQLYQSKRYSDVQLLVDTWWLIAVFDGCANLATTMGWRALWALSAFFAYRAVVSATLAATTVSSTQPRPVRLLLLRTFGPGPRAERLFDALSRDWRRRGNVNLIAAPDLAARTIDPGDILAFVGGEFHGQFVRDRGDLARRLAALDEGRDPDGRFRVNDFFCFDDTWRPTLEALLDRVDLVLMDLRGVSRRNAGCLFEMQKLSERAKLAQALFVVADDEEEQLLRTTVRQALAGLGLPDQPALGIARVRGASRTELARVLTALRALPSAP